VDEKILLVDDEPSALEVYQRILQKTYQVDTAPGGSYGLKMIAEDGPYAIVIADMQMPVMNGMEFVAQVKEQAPETVCMILTGHADTENTIAAINEGNIFRFLTKPCTPEVLTDAILAGFNAYREAIEENERISLKPLQGTSGDLWAISFSKEIMTLHAPDDSPVVGFYAEEAARYIRFDYDLLRGRKITIDVIPGLKSFSFSYSPQLVTKLQSWLPHKSPEQIAREIHFSGIGVGLFGVLHLVLPQSLFWGWGLLLLLTGLLGVVWPKRKMYLINSLSMLFVGIADLVSASPKSLDYQSTMPAARLAPAIVGGILILWFAHQLWMLSPNQQLRIARAIRDKRTSFLPSHSATVSRIIRYTILAAIASGFYAICVLAIAFYRAGALPESGAGMSMLPDIAFFSGIMVLAGASAALMLSRRKQPDYFEAKVTGQMLIAVLVLSFWSLVLNFNFSDPLSLFGRIFESNILIFERPYAWASLSLFGGTVEKDIAMSARPYVWVSLIFGVLVFNHWFIKTVDRELEEQRDEAA